MTVSLARVSARRRGNWDRWDLALLAFFVIGAVVVRLVFWLYTHRIWEDFLITLNPAQNFWNGDGLTHHVPEPRVYSFTSTLSIAILVIGEGFHQAINFNRVLSLLAAAAAIVYAARLMRFVGVNRVGQAACLAYLATDHLQVFFGMAGMETQVATAIALCTVYYAVTGERTWFGVCAGLALLARPDMLLLDGLCFAYVLLRHRGGALKPALLCSAIVAPWLVFATLYYGSPIPQTVTVKSYMAGQPDLSDMLAYTEGLWRQFAPFWEFWFVRDAPVPQALSMVALALTLACAALGIALPRPNREALWLTAAIAATFLAYLIKNTVNPYFMWYAPPFTALYFVVVAAGISQICSRSAVAGVSVAVAISIAYAAPIAFALPLDREMQAEVDEAVRSDVGRTLHRLMGPRDTVFMEPLGYIGIEIKDRLIYDYPGLGSKLAFAAVKEHGWQAVEVLDPDFIVFRPDDFDTARDTMPALLPRYEEVAHIKGRTGTAISFGHLTYGVADDEFYILRRRAQDSRAQG